MPEQPIKSIRGQFNIEKLGGTMTFSIEGVRPPADIKELPDYIAQLVKGVLFGATDNEGELLRARIVELEKTVDAKIAEIKDLQQLAKSAKPLKSSAKVVA